MRLEVAQLLRMRSIHLLREGRIVTGNENPDLQNNLKVI